MQLKPFLLDAWLDQYEHDIEFNLAASTGPTWTVNDILALADDETRHNSVASVGSRGPTGRWFNDSPLPLPLLDVTSKKSHTTLGSPML